MSDWKKNFHSITYQDIGPIIRGSEVIFRTWAPFATGLELISGEQTIMASKDEFGIWEAHMPWIGETVDYLISIDGRAPLPDPASRYQPNGVYGHSRVIQYPLPVSTEFVNLHMPSAIIYELHTGTFSPQGTFAGIAERLEHLVDLGVSAIELMPVSQFEGRWNWGYDGVFPYAVHNTYGTPSDLRELVERCHSMNLSVILDVVYNHIGPRGNIFESFGPFFSNRYMTPWGASLNFDGEWSDYVRAFFIQNAIFWLDAYGFDGLRLDAIHGIADNSPVHFLTELTQTVRKHFARTGKRPVIIGESDMNNPRVIQGLEMGGYGLDAQWCDDFHHSVHALATCEKHGYYSDYGEPEQVAEAFRHGFVYSGIYSSFLHRTRGYRDRRYRNDQLVVFSQDHDQVGNRPGSQRPTSYAGMDASMAMAAAAILSPYVPMLFMGEEFGTFSPFWFFIDTSDPSFASAVDKGRKEEFSYLDWAGDHIEPSDPRALMESRIPWSDLHSSEAQKIFGEYRKLISIRRSMKLGSGIRPVVGIHGALVTAKYLETPIGVILCAFNLSEKPANIPAVHGRILFSRNCATEGNGLITESYGVAVIQK
ncbi:MAG: malto-oligosyltrehalose trehalohydrolase [Candidatus Thermoplasmatota archaeon]|nr:malto-oligosyltrehalose trehalohydrolase [Candidatus Thermoplasmatota archaeon]